MPFRLLCRLVALVLVVLAGMSLAPAAAEDDWPDFRGPEGQGHAAAHDLPLTWSEDENVAWKTPLPGAGWSSPVINTEQIWLTTATEEGRSLRAVCVDRRSGEILHDIEVFRVAQPAALHATNSHASPSPVLHAGQIYVHFGVNGTACLDCKTGRVLWRNTELQLDHEVGPGSSPVLSGDLLLLTCDGIDQRYMAALNASDGSLAWQTPRSGVIDKPPTHKKAFTTPLLVEIGGRMQAISPAAERVIAYDPQSGQELWHVRYDGFSNVPRPLFGHGLVYVCTGYMQPQLIAIRPEGEGDLTSHIAWTYAKQVPAKPSPLLIGEELYLINDAGVAACLNALTGAEIWRERLGGKFTASPVYADGKIYACNEEGETFVLRPGGQFELLSVNTLAGSFMASPAVGGHELYLRTGTHLYRVEQTAAGR